MIEIYIAGITVGLFSIFNNIKNRKRSIQNSLLITILVLWVIRFSLFYLKSTSFLEAFPGIILIDQNLLFLDSVLLYLYTQSTYNTNFEWEKKLLHFIPFFIACALSLYIYLNIDLSIVYKSAENQIELDTFKPSFEEFLFIIFIILHNLVYLILSRVNLIRYNKKILDSYSSINNLQLKWLTKVIVIWVFLLVVPLIIYFISYLSSDMALEVMSDIFSICLLLSILIFSYFGINQEYAFQYNTTTIKKVNQKNEVLADKNTLQLKNDFKELSNFMSKEKPFLDPQLSIDKLAEITNKSKFEISNIINKGGKINFYEFVNSFRLEQIKKELINTNEQVLQIAYKNGFNSKSAFYGVFKKETSITPIQFRKKNNQKKESI